MATTAPQWTDEVELSYELFQVTPDVECNSTIARSKGTYTSRHILMEWCTPAFVQSTMEGLIAAGWTLDQPPVPAKPQEELDIANATIIARKRTAT